MFLTSPLPKIGPIMASILVAEDNAQVLEVLREYLSTVGHTAVRASTIEQARECLASEHIDLLLADQILPKGLGRSIAGEALALGIPVILMSGHPKSLEDLRDGPFPVLKKPFPMHELVAAIDRALGRAQR
jgi:DNA-binding NtrC family response regulator